MEDCLPFSILEDINALFLTLLFVKNSKRKIVHYKNVFQDDSSEIGLGKNKEEYKVL